MKRIKQRKKKFKKPNKPRNINGLNKGNLQYIEMEITDEPMRSKEYSTLPNSVREELNELYDLLYIHPDKSLPRLLELSEQYPHIPQIKNFISNNYKLLGEGKKSDDIAAEIYQQHPDYLFGKIDYAMTRLEKGQAEAVPAIFDNKLNLKLLYPHRNKFHISEVINFSAVMALYYFDIDEIESAKVYLNLLEQLDPEHPLTKRVRAQFSIINKIVKMLTLKI